MGAETYPVQFLPAQTKQNCARLLLMAFEVSELNNAQPWHPKRFEQRVITPHLFPEAYYHLRKMHARSIKLPPIIPLARFRPILQIGLEDLVEARDIRPDEATHCEAALGWTSPEPLARIIPFDRARSTSPSMVPELGDAAIIPLRFPATG